MNELIVNTESIFNDIRDDFSSLWSHRIRGETLEIFTPFSTMLGNMISVFLTKRDNRYIISDGKCVCELLSEHELSENNKNSVYLNETAQHYDIKTTPKDQDGYCFYFKSTTDIKLLSAYIYDLAFFENAALNSIYASQAFFQNEEPQWRRFSTRVNDVLNRHIINNLQKNRSFSLEKKNQVFNNLRFSAVLRKDDSQKLWFAMYISGSNAGFFSDHICRAITGFYYINHQQEFRSSAYYSIIVDEESKGYDLNNQMVVTTRSQLINSFHPQIYNFENFKNISNLDVLFQNNEMVN